jgi:membrane-anchored glycerophosphoryl diester phosphodiesterase (GDPDase)
VVVLKPNASIYNLFIISTVIILFILVLFYFILYVSVRPPIKSTNVLKLQSVNCTILLSLCATI